MTTYTAGELFRVEVKEGKAGRITALSGNHQLKFPDALRTLGDNSFLLVEGSGTLDRVVIKGDDFRRHADSWRFCDPDVGCPDRHDCVGE